jgi:nucleoside-diphosphate-sugar epimerase
LQPKPEQPRYLQINLLKPETLTPIATKIQPDVVIHLAAMAFVAEDDANGFYQVNLMGTRNLLEVLSAAKTPPECTIVASSANVYGNSTLEVLSEDSPINPANDYAISKLAMEYLAKTYMDRLGIVITRPFNYTGVGQSDRFLIPKIVEHFRKQAPSINLGNLHVERDYSDVRDISRYYLALAETQPTGQTLNLCSGTTYSISDILEVAFSKTGQRTEIVSDPSLIRDNEVHRLCGDSDLLKKHTAVKATYLLRDTLSWMLSI